MIERFSGHILGVGSASGTRVVVGRWRHSPLGSFADVMVARPDGRRILLAPNDGVAEYVCATYRFDEVRRVDVAVSGPTEPGGAWTVQAGPLAFVADLGARTPLGRVLRLVPRRVAVAPAFTLLTDPVARLTTPGVRTRGTAGGGRREFYGASDVLAVTRLQGTWDGTDLGALAPVDPPPGFGFGSTPRRPGVTTVTTTIVRA